MVNNMTSLKTKPIAYILCGVPGSGKSTWIENLAIRSGYWPKATVISTDNHIETWARVSNQTYSEVFDEYIKTAASLMIEDFNISKTFGQNIIWDQTNVSVKTRAKKLQMLNGYRKIAVVFKTPDVEELQRRLDSRPGKHIPKHVMKSMIDNFVLPTVEEGFDEIIFADNL